MKLLTLSCLFCLLELGLSSPIRSEQSRNTSFHRLSLFHKTGGVRIQKVRHIFYSNCNIFCRIKIPPPRPLRQKPSRRFWITSTDTLELFSRSNIPTITSLHKVDGFDLIYRIWQNWSFSSLLKRLNLRRLLFRDTGKATNGIDLEDPRSSCLAARLLRVEAGLKLVRVCSKKPKIYF